MDGKQTSNAACDDERDSLRIFSPSRDNILLAKWSFASTAAWMLVAHLYRWTHVTSASHDSIIIVQTDALWEISLGRFLQPLYVALRGDIAAPLLIGVFSILFLGLTIAITCKLLGLTKPLHIVLLSGVISTSATITLHDATYIYTLDLTMLTALLGALSVFWCIRFKAGFLLGVPCIFAIFALSPGYVTYPITLMLLHLLTRTLQGGSLKNIICIGIKCIAYLAIGAGLYLFAYPMIQNALDVAATSYKGFSEITDFSTISLLPMLAKSYLFPFQWMADPGTYGSKLIGIINIVLFVCVILGLATYCIKTKIEKMHLLLAIILLLLLPLGMDCTYFIVKGNVYELMYISFYLFYALVLIAFKLVFDQPGMLSDKIDASKVRYIASITLITTFAAIITCNTIYANQVYVKKDLEAQATLSTMTRIVDEIESLDSYIPGETPVAFVGTLNTNEPYSQLAPGFRHFKKSGLYNGPYSVTRPYTYSKYIKTVLNAPMNVVSETTAAALAEEVEVQKMPVFPHEGYCSMIDGTVVVRLSESSS